MAVLITVKAGHPTGTYRRGGYLFHAKEPVSISTRSFTDELRNDPWLVCVDEKTGERVLNDAEIDAHNRQAEDATRARVRKSKAEEGSGESTEQGAKGVAPNSAGTGEGAGTSHGGE